MEEPEGKTHKVEIGSFDTVIIEKMFGPTIFADLRITASVEHGWVIERRWAENGEWYHWCNIPSQIEQEFPKGDT